MSYLLVAVVVFVSAATGLVAKFILERTQLPQRITWNEYVVVMIIITLLVAPGSIMLGWEMAKANKLTYYEYWNGWETRAVERLTKCERDGNCYYNYDCDPYIVMVPYSCNCDSKGDCDTCYRPEVRYHSCPYVDFESDYVVETTVGNFLIAENRFPLDPQNHRWRGYEAIPEYIIQRAGVGPHPFWVAAKERLEEKLPGPVSIRKDYKNYIYASEKTILKQYSTSIKKYLSAGLFPALQSDIHDYYWADKVYFVGFKPDNADRWQLSLRYLNAALGMELQGDVHLLIIQNETISANPDEYTLALKAYWQDINRSGGNAFSKNATAILVGTNDGKTVSWARGFTGMPMGNEDLVTAVMSKFKGAKLDPENTIGTVQRKTDSKYMAEHGKGVLEDVVFGLSERKTAFQRISMSASHLGDRGGGFTYLLSEIQPNFDQQVLIAVVAFLFCCIGWVVVIYAKNYSFKINCY